VLVGFAIDRGRSQAYLQAVVPLFQRYQGLGIVCCGSLLCQLLNEG